MARERQLVADDAKNNSIMMLEELVATWFSKNFVCWSSYLLCQVASSVFARRGKKHFAAWEVSEASRKKNRSRSKCKNRHKIQIATLQTFVDLINRETMRVVQKKSPSTTMGQQFQVYRSDFLYCSSRVFFLFLFFSPLCDLIMKNQCKCSFYVVWLMLLRFSLHFTGAARHDAWGWLCINLVYGREQAVRLWLCNRREST